MNKFFILRGFVSAVAICAGAMIANAGQMLEIQSDESKMLSIAAAPGAVIVGNPSIADISVDGTNVFVHGRGFGQTTLLILDAQGNQLANFDIAVTHSQVTNVALFRGTDRFSYSCAPYCETELQIGDNIDHFKEISDSIMKKMEISTGSKTAEAKAPAAPQ
jgi:Pilus formation protein N terminal region